MKKLFLISGLLSFSFLFSQQKKSDQIVPPSHSLPYLKTDSLKNQNQKIRTNPSGLYKNIDSAKASKYKMLNKKPANQYSELQQTKPQLFRVEKPKDSTLLKKKK